MFDHGVDVFVTSVVMFNGAFHLRIRDNHRELLDGGKAEKHSLSNPFLHLHLKIAMYVGENEVRGICHATHVAITGCIAVD